MKAFAAAFRAAISFASVFVLVGCGARAGVGLDEAPGSPGGPPAPTAPAAVVTNFTAVAMAGEVLTYSLDSTNLTYSYTITDSQFGLAGKTGSGSLVKNSDGSYSPVGINNAKIVFLANGLLLGAIRETINGVLATIPIFGISNPVSDLASGVGTYNFVQRSCLSGSCTSYYGTFSIKSDATWTSCPSGNLITGCPSSTNTGTLNSLGAGKWQVLSGATDIGTAIVLNSDGQNVVMLDLKDTRAGGFGIGLLVGSLPQAIDTTKTDGTWVSASTNGQWGVFTASGTNISFSTVNGIPSTAVNRLTIDSPWVGMGTTTSGGHGLLAGTGVYLYEDTGGYAELGVKLN
jgi:hypothetical protein